MDEIRVTIDCDPQEGGWYVKALVGERDITEQINELRMISLRGYLPSEHRSYMRIGRQRYESVSYFLERRYGSTVTIETLPPQILADAIRAYITDARAELLEENGPIESVLESDSVVSERLAAAQPAFLSIGGRMFRLTPEAHTGAPVKVLDRMRKQASQAIAREREAMLAGARREAEIIRNQTERERQQLQQQIREMQRQEGGRIVLPPWLDGYTIKVYGGQIGPLQTITFEPEAITYPSYQIGARRFDIRWTAHRSDPVKVDYYAMFNRTTGSYEIDSFRLAQTSPILPHAHHGGFCCQPQGLPTAIRSLNDLGRVRVAIERTFRVVNLSSLLTMPEDWSDEIKAFFPEGSLQFFEDWKSEVVPRDVDEIEERYDCVVSRLEEPTLTWGGR